MILAISLWIALMVYAKRSRLENYFYSIFSAAVIFVATSSMSLYYSIKDFKLEQKSRKYGGVGLGLSICKKIIDRLGGSIQISSEPGKGSNFWFEVETQIDTNVAVLPPFDMKGKKAYVHLPEEKQMQAMVGYFQSWGAEVVNSLDELNKDNSIAIVEGTNQELIDEVAKREVRSIRVVDQVNDDEFSIDTPFCPRELKDKIVKLGVVDG